MRRPADHSSAPSPFQIDAAMIAAVDNPLNPVPNPLNPVPNPLSPVPDPLNPVPNPLLPVPNPVFPHPTAPPRPPGPGPGQFPVTPAEVGVADVAIGGPQARAGGLSGTGIKIGIMSDSFNLLGGAASDEANGLLPASGVTVLEEGPGGSNDEGRAMAELVHATAPGAQLFFYSAGFSESDFAHGIGALQAAGCQIIVDDISYFAEPMFQIAGPIDTAIESAVGSGVNYFTAAGNNGNNVYQAQVAPQLVTIAGLGQVWAQTFAGGATTQSVTVPADDPEASLILDWNAPYNGAAADTITVVVLAGSTAVRESVQLENQPVVALDFPVLPTASTYNIAILYSSGTGQPSLIKYVAVQGATINDLSGSEPTGSTFGHTLVPGVNAVGAINIASTPAEGGTPTPEPFSSTGGSEFLFAPDGTPLPTPEPANSPDFLAPDGAPTSVFDPFFGTSAAAPVAAATAALMLQANPALTTADVTALLEDTALPVASSDNSAGAGLIQANLATQFATTGVISGVSTAVLRGISAACTIQGSAGNQWLVAGSGATVIDAQGLDSVQAGSGADTVDLTGAQAAVYGSTGPMWVRTLGGSDTVVGGSGALTVSGGAGGGVIYGSTSGGNQLFAGAEQTTIVSRGTGDLLVGNGDGDQLYACNLGQDTVVGGSGTEILVGGSGGTNVFNAGSGTPLVAPEGSTAVVTFGTGGASALVGSGSEVLQVINGQAGGFDVVYGFDPAKDMLLLNGFAGEHSEAAAAIGNQYDTGGNSWVKLPDGTVIAFVGLDHLAASSVAYG